MPVLSPQQRNALESAVRQARKAAESGARNALEAMAVDHHEPFAHMNESQRSLRNQLRARARLLGDPLEAGGRQQIHRLCYELAYESWHLMLFARFLEANHLLMHPGGVPVSFADIEELAPEEGFPNKWVAAAAYASAMLPAIFRPEDPLLQAPFAPNDRIRLEEILDRLEPAIFSADDALGWVYQFWQSEAKAAINASGDKIDGEKLPAVTQLFTEPYMVQFLIDNTLGAWWCNRHPGIRPPLKFEYLRSLPDTADAAFPGWPDATADITVLDPCMGSGHFVAALFPVLAALRMHEEGIGHEEAARRVIAQNLHGLELDPRCTQIAAFNLALTAWKFCGHYFELPEMNLACSGIAPKGRVEDWLKLLGKAARTDDSSRLDSGMRALYRHFQLAPELGSLLEPAKLKADLFAANFGELRPALLKALQAEHDAEQQQRGVMAAGIAKAGQLLSRTYTLQITNVPYLSRGKQDGVIAEYCAEHYPEAKGDLATVFLAKMLQSNIPGGISCTVMPQNWLFLTSYRKLREKLLKNESWNFVARLGAKSFQTPMWDFNVMLISLSRQRPAAGQRIAGFDVAEAPHAQAKAEALRSAETRSVEQAAQLKNPDARVVLEENSGDKLLANYAIGLQGISPADLAHYGRYFWEFENIPNDFHLWQTTVEETKFFGGAELLLWWGIQLKKAIETGNAYIRGSEAWDKKGIVVRQVGNLPVAIYTGAKFDTNCAIIIPNDPAHLPAIWCFCSSPQFNEAVRKIDQKLNVTNATLVKVPFDLAYWQQVAAEKYPEGLPAPYSDDPTQWLFHGHPRHGESALQVALARLAGYRWPAEQDPGMELSAQARAHIADIAQFNALSDEDGILCLPALNGEAPAAERLRDHLQQVFGPEWGPQRLQQLLQAAGGSAANLEEWLRNEFFAQHCRLFQNRPFIWQVWDGRKDGFSALLNYHRLDRAGLSKLIYTYLGDWLRHCEARQRSGESGAEGLLSAARQLKSKLEAILEGEAPYDIFVRWKPLEQQPIGWEPDLNDGLRLNIRPFMEAGVLRKNPNIKWGIDRGKNPPGSPWGEIRDNDRHLTPDEKRAARQKP